MQKFITLEVKYHIPDALQKIASHFGFIIQGVYTVECPVRAAATPGKLMELSGLSLRALHSAAVIFIKDKDVFYVYKICLGCPSAEYNRAMSQEEKDIMEKNILESLREKLPQEKIITELQARITTRKAEVIKEMTFIQEAEAILKEFL